MRLSQIYTCIAYSYNIPGNKVDFVQVEHFQLARTIEISNVRTKSGNLKKSCRLTHLFAWVHGDRDIFVVSNMIGVYVRVRKRREPNGFVITTCNTSKEVAIQLSSARWPTRPMLPPPY